MNWKKHFIFQTLAEKACFNRYTRHIQRMNFNFDKCKSFNMQCNIKISSSLKKKMQKYS